MRDERRVEGTAGAMLGSAAGGTELCVGGGVGRGSGPTTTAWTAGGGGGVTGGSGPTAIGAEALAIAGVSSRSGGSRGGGRMGCGGRLMAAGLGRGGLVPARLRDED